ncbi:MAG: hypothetical protein JRI68_34285 [Deltaproteobacteria bacterium]|nr:hypothetical protein [Deltaproteobacteria bacterium]
MSIVGLATQVAGCGCTAADCGDSLVIRGPVRIATSEPADLHVRVCRNETCGHGSLRANPLADEPTGAQVLLAGAVDARVWLSSDPADDHWQLMVRFDQCDQEGEFEDGDIVELVVTDRETATVPVDLHEEVVFDTVAPNGTWCGPICLVAEITIPAP